MAKRSASSPASPRKRTTARKTRQDAADPADAAAPTALLAPSEDEIRVRAYHRYLERGATDGADFDDWLEAERDLRSPRHN